MTTKFLKTAIACSIAAASMFATTARADVFNEFTFNPNQGTLQPFKADKITGNYSEVATFNSDGTFAVSLLWNAGQFVTGGGNKPVPNTGLGVNTGNYGMYATYKATGTYVISGTVTTFTFTPGSGFLSLFLDRNGDTTDTAPGAGNGSFAFANTIDDLTLATGIALSGSGKLDTSSCSAGGINCGSFGSGTSFALTNDGKDYFVAPNPFYDLSFQSGQLNNFQASGTQVINGSLDVVFANAVPEPASLGLMGLGILGLGLARRRKQS